MQYGQQQQGWDPQAGSSGAPPGSPQDFQQKGGPDDVKQKGYGEGPPPAYGGPPPPGYGGQEPGYGPPPGQEAGYGGQAPGYGGPPPGQMSGYGGQEPGYGGPPPGQMQGPPPGQMQGSPPGQMSGYGGQDPGYGGPPPGQMQGPPPGQMQGPPPGQMSGYGGQEPGYGGPPPGQVPGYGGPPPGQMQGPPPGQLYGGPPPGQMPGPPPMQMSGFGGPPPPGYGGPPPPGYQAYEPQNYALTQAELDLAYLEEKKKSREEEKKQEEVQKMAKKIRSGRRDQNDNQACARSLCMWSIFNGLMYAVSLMGDDWMVCSWHAMGVEEMRITMGLFNLKVSLKCRDAVDMHLCHLMKPWAEHDNGIWSTTEVRDKVCEESKDYCITVDRLYYAGWPPLIFFPAAACFECLSMMLLWWYWHVKPTTMTRILADKCGIMACFCAALAFVGWFAVLPWMSTFPRMWATIGGQRDNANGVFTGFRETFRIPIGWCLLCAIFGIIGSVVRVISQHNLDFHVNEPDPYGVDEHDALISDAIHEAERQVYGTH